MPTGQTRLCRLIQSGHTLSFGGIVDVLNPVSTDDFGQELGFFGIATSLAPDPSDGGVWVTGFTAPRFDPAYPAFAPPFGSDREPLFVTPTLARIPANTIWSMTGSGTPIAALDAVQCHGMGLPPSLVVVPRGHIEGDYDNDGDVDLDDLELFKACFSGPTVPLPEGCESRDFDGDSDVDQTDFGVFQRMLGKGVPE